MAVTIIDHDGDLQLALNGGTLKVSRKVFCLSSPVFLAMLGEKGHFEESSGQNLDHEGLPTVSFADDDLEAMTFVALIIHLRSDKVPSEIGVEQAYQIARLCDKYDLKKCLGLWPQEWMNSLLFPRDLNTTCWNILLFSSYVCKSQLRFELATKKLVLDSKLLDDGRLVTSN